MGELKISTILVFGLVITLFMFGGGVLIADVMQNYGVNQDTSFNDSYGNIEAFENASKDMLDFFNDSAEETNSLSFILNTMSTPVRALRASSSFFYEMVRLSLDDIPLLDGFDTALSRVIMAILGIIISLLVVSAMLRWRAA